MPETDHAKTIREALERCAEELQLLRAKREPHSPREDYDPAANTAEADARAALSALSALQEERERMRRLLTNIVLNAVVVPDPAMKGLTDTYSVPLDDIEDARAAMEPAPQDQFSRPLWNSTVESLVASDTPEADRELQLRGYRPAPQEGRS